MDIIYQLFDWLFGWYNLPFVIPMGIAMGFVLIEVITGGLTDLFPSVHLDLDVDVDFDADLDMDMGNLDAPAWAVGLGWMGFGKAPFTILIEVMFATFGGVGLFINAVAADLYPSLPNLSIAIAIPVASVAAVLTTKAVGTLIYKYIPPSASTAKTPGFYVGHPAKALVRLTPKAGEVKVDGEHHPVFLPARSNTTLPKGSDVVLVSYDAPTNVYQAETASLSPPLNG